MVKRPTRRWWIFQIVPVYDALTLNRDRRILVGDSGDTPHVMSIIFSIVYAATCRDTGGHAMDTNGDTSMGFL